MLAALLFGGASKAMTTAPNRWTPEIDSTAYLYDGVGNLQSILHPQSSILFVWRGLGLATNTVNVGFDPIGQLIGWSAKEPGGALRQNEQLELAYDPAHNLHARTNGALAQTFTTDAANQLNSVARTGTLTLSGATPAPASSVTVNGQAAQIYGDFTFAGTNLALANGENTIITNIAVNLHEGEDLVARPKSDPAKLALAARLRQETTLSVKQIAERLGLGKPKGARTNLHKFMNRRDRGSPPTQSGLQ